MRYQVFPPLLILGLMTVAFARAENNVQPNVLFIAIDDLNDWVGCLDSHPQEKTPNIDALAQRGTSFTNAHCQAAAKEHSSKKTASQIGREKTLIPMNRSRIDYS